MSLSRRGSTDRVQVPTLLEVLVHRAVFILYSRRAECTAICYPGVLRLRKYEVLRSSKQGKKYGKYSVLLTAAADSSSAAVRILPDVCYLVACRAGLIVAELFSHKHRQQAMSTSLILVHIRTKNQIYRGRSCVVLWVLCLEQQLAASFFSRPPPRETEAMQHYAHSSSCRISAVLYVDRKK